MALTGEAPKPRVSLTRFHRVFAPDIRLRSGVTLGGSARRCREDTVETAFERRAAMTRAQRLKRVFQGRHRDLPAISGVRMKVIARSEDPGVIRQILGHLDRRAGQQPLSRAPPQGELPGFAD